MPGPRWPLGWTAVARLAGSVRSATGTVKTRAVSAGSTTPTGLGRAPPAEDGRHDEAADRDVEPGQHAEELDAATGRARSPPRPRAARPAAARRPAGRRPRGRGRRRGRTAGPACERSEPARSMSSSSGPRVALAEEDQHGGLPARAVLAAAGSGSAACGSTVSAARTTGSSQSGSPSVLSATAVAPRACPRPRRVSAARLPCASSVRHRHPRRLPTPASLPRSFRAAPRSAGRALIRRSQRRGRDAARAR